MMEQPSHKSSLKFSSSFLKLFCLRFTLWGQKYVFSLVWQKTSTCPSQNQCNHNLFATNIHLLLCQQFYFSLNSVCLSFPVMLQRTAPLSHSWGSPLCPVVPANLQVWFLSGLGKPDALLDHCPETGCRDVPFSLAVSCAIFMGVVMV